MSRKIGSDKIRRAYSFLKQAEADQRTFTFDEFARGSGWTAATARANLTKKLRQMVQRTVSGYKAVGILRLSEEAFCRLCSQTSLLSGDPLKPLLAPMAEGAAEARFGALPDRVRHKLRAFSAATDNVGLFFGEDIFVAFGAIVLMTTILRELGIEIEPIHVALWGIPTAVCAFVIHAWRLRRLDKWLNKEMSGQTLSDVGPDNVTASLADTATAAVKGA